MILADTSAWIDHFSRGDAEFLTLFLEGKVLTHPLVIEELACGRIKDRKAILTLLETQTSAPQADHSEFLRFVDDHRLSGSSLGVVDIHLLMSAMLARAGLLTRDKSLRNAASRLGIPVS